MNEYSFGDFRYGLQPQSFAYQKGWAAAITNISLSLR